MASKPAHKEEDEEDIISSGSDTESDSDEDEDTVCILYVTNGYSAFLIHL